jgi:hypothetical protein
LLQETQLRSAAGTRCEEFNINRFLRDRLEKQQYTINIGIRDSERK